jgi:hypothetical protein
VDSCDEGTQDCVYIPQNSLCADGDVCDGSETCDITLGCQEGTPIVCDDSVGCTVDTCDPVDGCVFTPDATSCQNSDYCDGDEICDPVDGCGPDPAGRNCDDLIACTDDSCDEGADICVHTPDDLFCSNGVYCDGDETCTLGVGCEAGTAVVCADDGLGCSVEECTEAAQGCVTTYDHGLCPQGQFCLVTGCTPGEACNDDADCDNDDDCDGVETCNTICEPGTVVVCDDGVGCTDDVCNPDGGACEFTPLNGLCVDTNLCNGDETCDATLDCQPGTPPNCDDGVGCTSDTCYPASGCSNVPDHLVCQDTLYCNGPEICDAVLDCQPSAGDVVCPTDGVDCTDDYCDESADSCVNDPNNTLCPGCGETCDPIEGCGNHCVVAECAGMIWQCGNCLDDDADCSIDSGDIDCYGACDNNESGWKGEIPGQNEAPCKMECYWDDDSGAGNDDCYWSHKCDPLEPKPKCDYDPNANIPGSGMDCATAQTTQSDTCETICAPLTPNGCDCFGCCQVRVEAAPCTDDTDCLTAQGGVWCDVDRGVCVHTVYLGTENDGGDGTCNLDDVQDPALCAPCTQVEGACFNDCGECELCFGMTELPEHCDEQDCPPGQQACGQPGDPPCPDGYYCITGCCVELIPG